MGDGPQQQTATKQRGRPFKKGQTGNPNGRPRKTPEIVEVETLAQTYTAEAVERLAFWMRSDNAKASVSAANTLIERGHGKARQQIEARVETTRYVVELPTPAKTTDTWLEQSKPH
jgi:hypothetical protein